MYDWSSYMSFLYDCHSLRYIVTLCIWQYEGEEE